MKAKTYSCDLILFKRLGLKPFEVVDREKFFVGKHSNVSIYVECYPAMFWTIIIEPTEGSKRIEINTGSGSLSNYWPTVELIIDGMIIIKEI